MASRTYNQAYYQQNKERLKKASRLYYTQNKEEQLKGKRLRYEKNKALFREQQRDAGHKLKEEVLTHYSANKYPVCAYCGLVDIDILAVDHINGEGNKHRRTIGVGNGTGFYHWLKRNNYPKGFQVLCYNCNMKKRMVYLRESYETNADVASNSRDH